MKILSRILAALVVFVGLASFVIQNRAHAAADAKKCEGSSHVDLALDDRNCECLEPEKFEEAQLKNWLKAAGIGEECYKIKFWVRHKVVKTWGTLDEVKCLAKEDDKCPPLLTRQPLGTSQTQRVMFNSRQARDAFEKQVQAARATASPTPRKK